MKPNLLAAISILLFVFSAHGVRAEGALAIGMTADLRKGFSVGWSADFQDVAEARADVLKRCRAQEAAPQEIRDLCRVFETFRDQCVSIALDPKDGETGTGWSVADTREIAEREALAACRNTASRNRQKECRILTGGCDGKAKGIDTRR